MQTRCIHMLNTKLSEDRATDSGVFYIALTAETHSCIQSGSCRTDPERADKRKSPSPSHFAFPIRKPLSACLKCLGYNYNSMSVRPANRTFWMFLWCFSNTAISVYILYKLISMRMLCCKYHQNTNCHWSRTFCSLYLR